ncbi:hypothetical protein BZG13_10295 [Salinivibrio sp. ML323]|nr:hypothetical protein BZG13_10295 [Salinivibrio sp. ML323]
MNTNFIVPEKIIKVVFALFISILISGCNSEETTQTDKINKDTNIASPTIEGNDINEQNNSQESQNKEKNETNLPNNHTAMVHLFEWRWEDVAQECAYLGQKGFSAVQVSPPNEHIIGGTWWTRYQPVSYRLNSRSGNRDQFIDMVNTCKEHGVDIYADLVINHTADITDELHFPDWGENGTDVGLIDKDGRAIGTAGSQFERREHLQGMLRPDNPFFDGDSRFSAELGHYHQYHMPKNADRNCTIDGKDYHSGENPDDGTWRVQHCDLSGLPDLNTADPHVQQVIAAYIDELIALGVKGFRVDAAKHIAVDDLSAILDRVTQREQAYFFSEVIDTRNEESVRSQQYTPIAAVEEFRYGQQIARVFTEGNLHWLKTFGSDWKEIYTPSDKAVVFLDNHDNQRGHGAGGSILTHQSNSEYANIYDLANVFMLAWDYGYPRVMSSYAFTNSELGPPEKDVHQADGRLACFAGEPWVCEHRWRAIANMVAFRQDVRQAPISHWYNGAKNQIAFAREGRGFVAINHSKQPFSLSQLQTSLPAGQYCNVIEAEIDDCADHQVTVDKKGRIDNVTVGPQKALAIHLASRVKSTESDEDIAEEQDNNGQDNHDQAGSDQTGNDQGSDKEDDAAEDDQQTQPDQTDDDQEASDQEQSSDDGQSNTVVNPLSETLARGHWVDKETLVWHGIDTHSIDQVTLYYSDNATLRIEQDKLQGYDGKIELTPVSYAGTECQPVEEDCRFGYLDGPAYQITLPEELSLQSLLKRQHLLAGYKDGQLVHYDRVQLAGVLDALYANRDDQNSAYHQTLGVSYHGNEVEFALWAPLAQHVSLEIRPQLTENSREITLKEDKSTGIWSTRLPKDEANRHYYRYHIEQVRFDTQHLQQVVVSDPYSVNVSANGEFSQALDLADPQLFPDGWDSVKRPVVANPTDLSIYEAHVRDFSARDQSTLELSPGGQDYRGKYLAFTLQNSEPVQHLQSLADAGLTTLHLLPINNLGSINEDPNQRIDVRQTLGQLCQLLEAQPEHNNAFGQQLCASEPTNQPLLDVFAGFEPTSSDANNLWQLMRGLDSYNWGYDPFHFNVPEGSYASDANGPARVIETRQMIQAIHKMGLTVALDVAYNHTYAAGPDSQHSVLDKVVPSYYHRLNPSTGAIENSTCCDNTATEWAMMEKLMVDSIKVWSEYYHIDAFRFDLMGHIPLKAGLRAREAVQAIYPETYFYGEGWNFGEVKNDARFRQATQLNKAGTGIGTFNDRLREAVREGGIFATPWENGHALNVVRYGLLGNLRSNQLPIDGGIRGEDYLWNGQITGYSLEPNETVNYVSKHDNPTLWDNFAETLPNMDTAQRVKVQQIAMAYPLLAQGIPFIHMGQDLLRSKSMDRDSYNSGDWFNYVDFTQKTNNWNVGLPSCEKNSARCGSAHDRWDMILDRIEQDPNGPSPQDITQTHEWLKTLLQVRSTTPLLRLATAQQINDQVRFHNVSGQNGLVVMQITASTVPTENQQDQPHQAVVVLINNSAAGQDFDLANTQGQPYRLHPALAASQHASAHATFTNGTFSIPAFSASVFVVEKGQEVTDCSQSLYLRGSMNDWSVENSAQCVGVEHYRTMPISVAAGDSHEFKFANDDWSHEVNAWIYQPHPQSLPLAKTSDGNFSVHFAEAGDYVWWLDRSQETPVVGVFKQ